MPRHRKGDGIMNPQDARFPSGVDRRSFIKVAALACVAPLLSGLSACGQTTTSSNPPVSSIDGFDGTFIVGFDQDFPPYGYIGDNGQLTGFDLDLAQAVCEKEGWSYAPKPISWDAKDALLNSGQIVCIWNGFTIEGRAPVRAHTEIFLNGEKVGDITSGGFGATVNAPVAMGYVRADLAAVGTKLTAKVRDKDVPIEIVAMPFVRKDYKK